MQNKRRIVVGMTGASGAILGIRLLEELRNREVETHLVLSKWAERTIALETSYDLGQVKKLAAAVHDPDDLAASVSSGSFHTDGMVICPCSMKSLAAVACGFSYNLIVRCADVTLKEGRKLILVPRETPLSAIHLENLLKLAQMGVKILPPCIGFYARPRTLDDAVNHLVGKVLDLLELENHMFRRWGEPEQETNVQS